MRHAQEAQEDIIDEYGLGPANAFTHAYWMGQIAYMVSPDAARDLGIAHELDYFETDIDFPAQEARKDLMNNEIGIEHGSQARQLGSPDGGFSIGPISLDPVGVPGLTTGAVGGNGVYGGALRAFR
jgi:hypothetical protein